MSMNISSDVEISDISNNKEAVRRPGVQFEEAVEIYGDAKIAESYGYVSRGLKARHVQFMGIGGSIGTALFLGIGRALIAAGPLSMLLGFSITGVAVFGMMQCLGEMTIWLPVPGVVPNLASRYVDSAVGFAIGWMGWYTYAIAVGIEVSAAAVVIGFWDATTNVAVWITIFLVIVISINIFAVSIYGEAEFWFASLKIVTIIGLLVLSVILDLGGGPNHDRIGFRYWNNPGAMKPFVANGNTGRFLGVFFSVVIAAYTYAGTESVVIAAGEAQDPRKNLPKAIRRVFWRLVFFYVFGSLAIGVLVPFNSPNLLAAQESQAAGAAQSPWVIAINTAGIPVLPSIINAVILTSAISAGSAHLYTGSRYLMSMAQVGLAPKIFMRCAKNGVPYYGVALTTSLSFLTYLSCASGPGEVFIALANFATSNTLIAWTTICITYLRFYAALKKQGVSRDDFAFRSPFQPYLAWICVAFFSIVLLFNGFYAFTPWDIKTFIATYIGIPLFLTLFGFWKIYKRTKLVDAAGADIWTGKGAIDAEVWPVSVPKNTMEKIWAWIV